VDQWIRFIAPGGWALIWLWHFWATVFCVLGVFLLNPVSWVEENWGWADNAVKRGETGRVGFKIKEKGLVREDGLSSEEVLRRTELRGNIIG
jgi:hypothetical protein